MKKNAQKYPKELVKGSAKKYTQYKEGHAGLEEKNGKKQAQ